MKKFSIALVLTFCLLVAQVSAVGMFMNWPDGGDDLREFTQGQDVAFNYDAFDFSANVATEVLLIDARNPDVPVVTLVDRTDFKGHYGYVVFETDNLRPGEYSLFGTATANGVTSVDYLDFDVVQSTTPNTPPYFVNLPDYFEYRLSEESDVLINIASFVRDDEGDSLSISLDQTQTDTDVVECNLFFESSLRCEFIGQGITTIDVVISDGEFSVTQTVTIKIIDDTVSNTAPYWRNLPSPFTYELEENQVTVLQLSDFANDDENDPLTYSVSGGNGIVSCSVTSSNNLRCTLLQVGSTDISVTVSDGELSDTESITIDVVDNSNQNTAPYFQGLPLYYEYPVGQQSADLVDLADYAFDNEGDQLSFSLVEGIGGITCQIVQDSVVRCNWSRETFGVFTVTVSDGQLEDNEVLTIKIVPDPIENTAPYWNGLPFNYEYPENSGVQTLAKLSDFAFDADGDTLSFILDESNTNQNIASCFIDSNSNLRCDIGNAGTTKVEVVVSDGELSDTQTLTINVIEENKNRAPYFVDLPVYLEYNIDLGSVIIIDLADHGFDPDGDVLTYSIDESFTDNSIIDCRRIDASRVRCDLNGVGGTSLTVSISDGEFSDERAIAIRVIEDPNNPPVWSNNLDLFYRYNIEENRVNVFNARDFVSDPDGDSISLRLDQSQTNRNIIDCRLANSGIVTCDLEGLGTSSFELIASDGESESTIEVTIEVFEDPNNPPKWDDNLQLYYEYDIDESPVIVFDAGDFVSDPDGDSLTFKEDEENTNFDIIDCFMSGDNLVCNLRGLGTSTVDVIASDGESESRITVTIYVFDQVDNNAPYWLGSLPDYFEYDIDEDNVNVIDLDQYAVDPDRDPLTFTIDQSNTNFGVVDCRVRSNNVLNCDLNGVGITTLDVIVSDGQFTDTETITIRVTEKDINQPPKWSNQLDLYYSYHIDESPVTVVRLTDFVSDPDGNSISLRLDQSQTDFDVINCFISNGKDLVCRLQGVGTSSVDVIASDGQLESDVTITITVYDDPNQPPYWKSNMPMHFQYNIEEDRVNVIDLQKYAVDPDGDPLAFSLDEFNTDLDIINCRLYGSTLRCDLNGVGETTIDVIVSDGKASATKTLSIKVTEQNYPPKWKSFLPDYFEYDIDEGNVDVLNLADFVSDPDGDQLTFRVEQSSTEIVDCDILGNSILNCDLNSVGTTSVTVIVSDGEYDVSERIRIRVYQDNEPPFFVNIPMYFEYDLDERNVQVLNIANYVEDPDDDDLTFSLDTRNTDPNVIDCTLQYRGYILNCNLNGVGQTTVDIIVSDGEFTISKTITIRVFQDDIEHEWDANLPTSFRYPLSSQVVTVLRVSDYVINPDNNDLSYLLNEARTNPNVIDCSLNEQTDIICVLNGVGTTTVDIRVSDEKYTIIETLTIEVYDDNSAPYFSANMPKYFEYNLDEGNVHVIDVADYVFDADGDRLSYALDQSNTDFSVVDCYLDGSKISCNLNGVGQTMVDIVVSDGTTSVRETLTIRVVDDNSAPYFDANIPNYFEFPLSLGSSDLFKVSNYINDDDGDQVSLSLDQSNTDLNVVDCALRSDSTLNCVFNGVGTTTVDLVATDGEFTVRETVTIRIFDDGPTGPVAVISANSNRNILGMPFNFDGFASFTVPGESIVSYEWSIFDHEGSIIAAFTGPAQSYVFPKQAEYTIELTVTDSQGLQDTDTYVVQARRGKSPKQDFGPEEGIFINSLEIYGTSFERAEENGEIIVYATIENTLDEDLKNVRMVLTIPEVGYRIKSNAITLRDGERETLQIFDYLPDYVTEGVYYPIVSFSDSEVRRSKPMYLEVSR